jgi:hypothetical protein
VIETKSPAEWADGYSNYLEHGGICDRPVFHPAALTGVAFDEIIIREIADRGRGSAKIELFKAGESLYGGPTRFELVESHGWLRHYQATPERKFGRAKQISISLNVRTNQMTTMETTVFPLLGEHFATQTEFVKY